MVLLRNKRPSSGRRVGSYLDTMLKAVKLSRKPLTLAMPVVECARSAVKMCCSLPPSKNWQFGNQPDRLSRAKMSVESSRVWCSGDADVVVGAVRRVEDCLLTVDRDDFSHVRGGMED
jgi:hypothetical protein